MRRAAAVVLALCAGGCLRNTQFQCTNDAECTLASIEGGHCEATGFCSFPDSNCVSGRHYGDHSGSLSNFCVDLPDAGGGGDQAAANCAPAFQPLAGTAGHVYQLFATGRDFLTQRGTCAVQGPAAYLAIPDDASEMQALVTLAGQPAIWVGLTDEVVEGEFLTVRGDLPIFLPFGTGQPDDAAPGEDCVTALSTGEIQDDRCDLIQPMVCECDP